MRQIVAALTVVFLTCGATYAEEAEPGPGFDHLKGYGPMIGTWQYKGPLLEDIPGIADKGSDLVWQFAWKRILNRSVVELDWSIQFKGGTELAGKALQGWNADRQEIVTGMMNSFGGMSMGTVVLDEAAKTSKLTAKGIDGEGKDASLEVVVTVTGKDTLTWKALERTGDIVEGPSPVYTFKRVERTKKEAK